MIVSITSKCFSLREAFAKMLHKIHKNEVLFVSLNDYCFFIWEMIIYCCFFGKM